MGIFFLFSFCFPISFQKCSNGELDHFCQNGESIAVGKRSKFDRDYAMNIMNMMNDHIPLNLLVLDMLSWVELILCRSLKDSLWSLDLGFRLISLFF